MIWTIAWRNVWRNTKRSGILIASIAFGIFAGLLMMALMYGMAEQQVRAAIATRTSHIQIHAEGFRAHKDINTVIPDADSLVASLRSMSGIRSITRRSVLIAMASSSSTGRGVELTGIDPEMEKRVTDVHSMIIEGSYFDTEKRNPAVIGKRLAEKLGVRLGRKIVLQGQATDGSIAAGAFRIVGIFETVSSMFDESVLFVRDSDLDRTFALDGAVHEIAILMDNIRQIEPGVLALRSSFPHLEVATWRELSPEVALSGDSTRQMNRIFMIVILAALVFGITNTMLMGVLERTRELGVILALGMNHGRVFAMILLESIFLSIVGGIVGILAAAGVIAILGKTGVDLTIVRSGFEAFGMDAVVYPVIPVHDYPFVAFLVIATAMLASIYPGMKAVRMKPVEAIRTC